MIGLVMAGGKGSRMDMGKEKLLLDYKQPIILHVIDALKESGCFSRIVAATSPNSPQTKKFLEQNSIEIIDTPGNGYSEDLNFVLQKLDDLVFVASGDLPFLDSSVVKKILSQTLNETWMSYVVSKEFLQIIGLEAEFPVTCKGQECFYTGISIVNAKNIQDISSIKENFVIFDNEKIAFNLNTKTDYESLKNSKK